MTVTTPGSPAPHVTCVNEDLLGEKASNRVVLDEEPAIGGLHPLDLGMQQQLEGSIPFTRLTEHYLLKIE